MAENQTLTISAMLTLSDPLLTTTIHAVRNDLKDLVSADYKWSDAELTRHIEHAISDVSQYRPYEIKAICHTVADSFDVDISACTGRVKVKKIEYPVGQNPPENPDFTIWGDTLTMSLDSPPSASDEDVYVYYGVMHTIDGVPTLANKPVLLDLVIDGATAYAAFAAASLAVDSVNIGGANVNLEYLRLCQQKLNQYWRDLKRVKTLR
jgi:hypothetical protein